ncbi:cupredoxin family copper-binding protein [Candidatus Woesearchaeota archaeon]|nr:cupredoxin family copper-binding protein [Candidatus Woesearchaeota archaeon]
MTKKKSFLTFSMIFILILGLLLVGCAKPAEKIEMPSAQPAPAPQPPPLPPVPEQPKVEETKAPEVPTIVNVEIKGSKFNPQDLKIKVGTTVIWTNQDSASHTVTSSDKTLDSPDLSKGQTFSYTFTTLGVYNYICSIHPYMKGTVTVE